MNQRIYNIASIVAILILFAFLFKTCDDKKSAEKIMEDSKSEMQTWKDKAGRQHAKITQLVGSYNDLQRLNSSKDSTLKKLQALVDKHTTSATVLNTSTSITGSGHTHVTFPTTGGGHNIVYEVNDTLPSTKHIPCDTIYPIYSDTINTKWTKGTIVANKDSIHYNIKTFNEFEIKETLKRDKWWQEKKQTIEVVSLNPNTETIDMKSFLKQPKKARRGLIFVGGFTIGVATTIILLTQLK